jgi:hypothetical protein
MFCINFFLFHTEIWNSMLLGIITLFSGVVKQHVRFICPERRLPKSKPYAKLQPKHLFRHQNTD